MADSCPTLTEGSSCEQAPSQRWRLLRNAARSTFTELPPWSPDGKPAVKSDAVCSGYRKRLSTRRTRTEAARCSHLVRIAYEMNEIAQHQAPRPRVAVAAAQHSGSLLQCPNDVHRCLGARGRQHVRVVWVVYEVPAVKGVRTALDGVRPGRRKECQARRALLCSLLTHHSAAVTKSFSEG